MLSSRSSRILVKGSVSSVVAATGQSVYQLGVASSEVTKSTHDLSERWYPHVVGP